MKLVTFVKSGEERLGLLAGDTVIDPLLAGNHPRVFANVLAFIKSGAAGLDAGIIVRGWGFQCRHGLLAFGREVEAVVPPQAYYDKSRRIRSAFNCSPPAC